MSWVRLWYQLCVVEKNRNEVFEEDVGEVSDNNENKISAYRLPEVENEKKNEKRNKILYASYLKWNCYIWKLLAQIFQKD